MTDAPAPTAGTSLSVGRRVLVSAGTLLLKLLMWSWRIEKQEMASVAAARARGEPFVLAFWHGRMLGALAAHRESTIHVLVSEHRDGELIARVLAANGIDSIRGSTTRGGARALLRLVASLKQGNTIAITPDGPRGPRHEVAPGLFAAAQRAGAPIVPMAVAASRSWQLRSWDRFEIPKPFARVIVRYGALMHIPEGRLRDNDTMAAEFAELLAGAQSAAEDALRA